MKLLFILKIINILDYFKNSKIYLMNEKLVYIRKHDKNMTNKKEYKKL